MTTNELVQRLQAALPGAVRSVVLYGSAATGDALPQRSDQNVLVVLERLDVATLTALRGPITAWVKAGNHVPTLFTRESLRQSADVFPIELLDLQDARQVLFGDDPLRDVTVQHQHLRWQIEQELKGKLMRLRADYLLQAGNPKRVTALLMESLPKFLILFRATARLYGADVPAQKLAATEQLARYIALDVEVFALLHAVRAGQRQLSAAEAEPMFGRYLAAVEQVVHAVEELPETQTGGIAK